MIFLFLLNSFLLTSALDVVTVSTDLGDVQGFRIDNGDDQTKLYFGKADVFLGIPFVEPPVGSLRFAKPKTLEKLPSTPWNATYYRSACPQRANANPFVSCGQTLGSTNEDCLYLNVFAPSGLKTPTNRAVMVFIHGGSLTGGCAQDYPYNGATRTFISQDVVVVTIQYRLGFLGLFTTQTDEYPANRALLDQIEALKWVQRNIANFGGDPKRVTIFGESAGSGSVAALSFSPLARGLFQQTIQESGAMACQDSLAQSVDQAQKQCNFTAQQFNSKQFSDLTTCLTNRSVADILSLDGAWAFVFDNSSLPGNLETLAKDRPNYPVLYGNMRDEYTYFILHQFGKGLELKDVTRQLVETSFRNDHSQFGDSVNAILSILEKTYHPSPLNDTDNVAWLKMMSDIYSGELLMGPTQVELDFYLANGNQKVFLWEHDYPSNVGRIYKLPGTWDPVAHGAELFFMWLPDAEWKRAIDANEVTSFDYDLVNWYSQVWTNFAKTGSPTTENSWLPVGSDRSFFRLAETTNGGMRMVDGWRREDTLLWNTVIPTILQQQPSPSTCAPADTKVATISSFSFTLFAFFVYF